jgi:nicotinamidase/pyrazinamidase
LRGSWDFGAAMLSWSSTCNETSCPAATSPYPLAMPTPADPIVSKGTDPSAEAYSAFSGTNLLSLLQNLGVHRVFVGGLATDYCVLETVSDARAHGLNVVVLQDAIRAVNVQPNDATRALNQMQARGAAFFTPSAYSAAPPDRHR